MSGVGKKSAGGFVRGGYVQFSHISLLISSIEMLVKYCILFCMNLPSDGTKPLAKVVLI